MKLNTAAALLIMPVLGGLMVVFLPFIGLYLTATVAPGWAPGAAYMTGKATDEKAAEGEKGEDAKLAQLAKEVEEQRKA